MKLKRVVFEEYDTNHAALILKLKSIKVSQKDFFQSFTRLFLQGHPTLDGFTEYLMDSSSKLGKKPRKTLHSSALEGKSNLESFNLTDEEVSGIFDILESDLNGGSDL